jgi:uncharacterized SAM-binding protein YcdF (DUF218 family)
VSTIKISGVSLSKVLAVLILAAAVWILGIMGGICVFSTHTDLSPADAAIVLGAAVWGDRPSPVFEQRIKHAVELYETGQVSTLVLTGGLGEGQERAESEVAREYAIRRGVDPADILIETRSTITYENLQQAKRILEHENLGRVLIVSDPLHMKRSLVMAKDMGMDAHPSPTETSQYRSWSHKLGFLLRETFFYAGYLIVGH